MSLNSLINLLGKYNFFLDGHTLRVFFLNSLLVKKIPLPPEEKELITAVAYLHSIGKIFSEPKALTENEILNEKDEKTLMKRHTLDSVHILSNFGFDQSLIKIVLLHHERIDGQGYPLSIKNKEIPLGSKIIAIADSFDSLTLWRPYRNHLSIKEAQKELILNSNTQFDSFLLNLFLKTYGSKPKGISSLITEVTLKTKHILELSSLKIRAKFND